MDRRVGAGARSTRGLAVLAAGAMLPIIVASAVGAQTLTEPYPKPRQPAAAATATPPQDAAKTLPSAQAKWCATYGAGFVYIPGTDGCIKIGGFVTVEGSAGR